MLDSTWSSEPLAVLVIIALVASCVIGIVILSSRPLSFVYAALAGLFGGIVLRLTPVGQQIAHNSTGLAAWVIQPLIGAGFALLVAGVFELLFSPGVPLLGRARSYGRRALRPWRWGTGAEFAERTGLPSWLPGVLGLGIEPPRPMTAQQLMAQARIVASVLCGSCVGVFFALPGFRSVLAETLTFGHILANLIATAFVTYLLEPLHEEVMQLADHGSPREHKGPRDRRVAKGLFFAVTGILLVLLQAVHTAIHEEIKALSLYEWILLLELCALPLLVTAYYFGAALYRVELGDRRWDRALEASVFAGTVVLAPYTIIYWLTQFFPPEFRASLIEAISADVNTGQIVFLLLSALFAILTGIGTAVIVSAATYGIYAVALALAMSGATHGNIRVRSCVAVLIAGAIAQGLLSLAVWYFGIQMPARHYLHVVVAAGWAVGLYASQFQEEMPQAEPVAAQTA